LKNASQVSSCWPYTHDKFEDEFFTENSQDWDKVMARMAEPKMTRFRAMSLDGHEKTIDKSTQEAIRSNEEMIVAKATKVPLVALVQDRGFPMMQDTRERGFLMIEQAQLVIDQLKDDSELIGMMRSPIDNPDESQRGPSSPELINIDEITRLDNPEITTPQTGSSGGVTT
jgi:hypothetical protein